MSKFQPKSTIESSNFNDENPLFVRNLKISMKFGRTIWRKSILFNEASQKIHRIYGMDLLVVGQVVFQNSMRWCDLLNGDRRRGT